jgi:hypothetical protein
MKALLTVAVVVLAASSAVSFAQDAQTEAAMKDCFCKHGNLMDKPAVKNMRDCWRTHGYKMERS